MSLFSSNIEDLRGLYTTQLRYLLSTEEQIIKALPKMVDAASSPQLKQGLKAHLNETEQHRQRLEQILGGLKGSADDKKCAATAALIDAGETTVKSADNDGVRDAGIIAACQKIEHFEIASYGSAREWATLLGENEHALKLEQTLKEEKHADEALTQVSREANRTATRAA